MVGLNVLSGLSVGARVALPDGDTLITSQEYDGPVNVTFSPAAVTVGLEPMAGSARNQWPGRVMSATPHGLVVRLTLDVAGGLLADVTAESAGRLGLVPGREIWATVKATEVAVLPEHPQVSRTTA
jgi:molybdate transport system ATP-binding protein